MKGHLYLPAIRGVIGDWTYYSCLMTFQEAAERIDFAKKLHKSKRLSEFIQRELQKGRAKDITTYLKEQPQRFFNSLVVAVYGGEPVWFQLGRVTPESKNLRLEDIDEEKLKSVGLLRFSGKEEMFAIDGQHRLAGIKAAIDAGHLGEEDVPVVLVGHKNTKPGMERSRRLFTTLNKTAAPVSKGETIALDEDDVMAIVARHLVEEDPWFSSGRIVFRATNNLVATDEACLTTLGNLYDLLGIYFARIAERRLLKSLKFYRPSEDALKNHRLSARHFFELLRKHVKPLAEFFDAKDAKGVKSVVTKHRGAFGGSAWFRPVGLSVFFDAVATYCTPGDETSITDAVSRISKVPDQLTDPPFVNVLWNPTQQRMLLQNRVLARNLVLFLVGKDSKVAELHTHYLSATGGDKAGWKAIEALAAKR